MSEISDLLNMSYDECCSYLKNKYGVITKNYFTNETFKYITQSIKRGKEGLYVHHIDEDKAIMLSSPNFAAKYPFSYQHGDRLVYCNHLEHLVLHIKIIENPHPNRNHNDIVGVGGVFNFIIPELNDIYCGMQYKQDWRNASKGVIIDRFNEYIECIEYLMNNFKFYPLEVYLSSFNVKFRLWEYEYNTNLYDVFVNRYKQINKITEDINWRDRIISPTEIDMQICLLTKKFFDTK